MAAEIKAAAGGGIEGKRECQAAGGGGIGGVMAGMAANEKSAALRAHAHRQRRLRHHGGKALALNSAEINAESK